MSKVFRLTPLLISLLLIYPAIQAHPVLAEETPSNTLPNLGQPSESPGTLNVGPNGATFDNRFDGMRLVISPEYGNQSNFSLGGAFAFPLGERAATGLVFRVGNLKKELLVNLGLQVDETQRVIFNLGQMRQSLGFGFISGLEKVEMTQNNAAVSYQFRLMQGVLNSAEINGYYADTPSRDLADKTYALDTATFYELWNDPRRVAGGRVTGLQGRLAFTPLPGSALKLGAGGERLEYDYLTGKQRTARATGSIEWIQQLAGGIRLNAGADAAVQNRYTLGLESPFGDGWLFGVNFVSLQGRDGAPGDKRLSMVFKYDFGGKSGGKSGGNRASYGSGTPAWGSLVDEVAKRPAYLLTQAVAKVDTTAAPLRLIDVNKAALPAGSSVNVATGVVTTPLGIAVTGIAGVTLNGAAFANTGQFAVSGNNLITDPTKIVQPAIGVIDTYVITVNNLGGGSTLVTVLISHGSVKIDSITLANGAVTPAAPTVTADDTANTVAGMATGMEYSLDGAAYVVYNAATFNAISFAGVHTLLVRVAAAGINPASAVTTLSFTTNPVTPVAPLVTADDTANTVAGMATGMEYSLDGAAYVAYNAAIFNAISFAGAHTLLVRVAAAGINPAGTITTLSFTTNPVTPVAPTVTADDTANTVAGMASGMEYSLDGAAYVAYNAATFNAISFAGNHTLLVRVTAAGINPTSAATTLSFTTNPVTPVAPLVTANDTANTVTGMATGMEYSLDGAGYVAYNVATFNAISFAGVHTLLVRVAAAGINPFGLVTTLNFTTNPVTPAAPTVSADDVANTVTGMASGMEYSLDGAAYVAYNAATFNAISFAGVRTLLVRVAAAGINPAGAIATLSFTTNTAAPTASAASISGTAQVGQLLTGAYTYADTNGDPQGVSTFRWLRNGAAIAGATASSYTLVVADVGNTITFEVTPVSSVAPTTGTPVLSGATAAVAAAALPAGYISQGGLTWTPNTIGSATFGGDFFGWGIPGGYNNWTNANAYCTNTTINGQTGWRLPTQTELSALYSSGALAGAQGWTLGYTWSSTPFGVGFHYGVGLFNGSVHWFNDANIDYLYVSCVR
ncbi:MAG: hypothetical protein Q7U78_10210 [Gallionella sp.]|nr:hypothetical protein [Gallionella sp.]